ncbi:MAG TPA: ribosome silencing factor [Blastocatellia bacterium]|nr:ribosome silencing factor [Blastocatellia bacterium]
MSRKAINEDAVERPARLETEEAVMLAAHAASDRKAADMVILDLRDVAQFTEYFLICTANNSRQVQAVTDAIEENLRQAGKRPSHIEGYTAAEWVLLDYGDFIAHVFSPASRRFYDLERLWRDAKQVPLPADLKP